MLVELPGGAVEYKEPAISGPRKEKEIYHIFEAELVYAPAFVALSVGVVFVVLFLFYLFRTCCLGVSFNNIPASFTGKINLFFFVVFIFIY